MAQGHSKRSSIERYRMGYWSQLTYWMELLTRLEPERREGRNLRIVAEM